MRMMRMNGGAYLFSNANFFAVSNEPDFYIKHPRGALTLLQNPNQNGNPVPDARHPDIYSIAYEAFADLLSLDTGEVIRGLRDMSNNGLWPSLDVNVRGISMVYLVHKQHRHDGKYIGYRIPSAAIAIKGFDLERSPSVEGALPCYSIAFENGEPRAAIYHEETSDGRLVPRQVTTANGDSKEVIHTEIGEADKLLSIADRLRLSLGAPLRSIKIGVVAPTAVGYIGAFIRPALGVGIELGRRSAIIERVQTRTLDEIVDIPE